MTGTEHDDALTAQQVHTCDAQASTPAGGPDGCGDDGAIASAYRQQSDSDVEQRVRAVGCDDTQRRAPHVNTIEQQ